MGAPGQGQLVTGQGAPAGVGEQEEELMFYMTKIKLKWHSTFNN